MTDARQAIENEVKSNDVVLFMKGTPQFPHVRLFGPGGADPGLSRRAPIRA